jgi:hypothetical protein
MCGCMRALVACIPACVCARACECCECVRERRERRRNPSARPPNVCHYVHIYVGTCICVYEQIPCKRVCVCARVCRVRARVCGMPICTTCVCIDARASRRVRMPTCAHAHAHRRLHLRLAAAMPSCMRVWMDVYACVYRWLSIDGRASVCMYMCVYITISISLVYIYYALIRMHYVWTHCSIVHTGVDECVQPNI